MARKHKPNRLAEIFNMIRRNPGQKPGRVAQELNIPRSSVTRALPALEEQGYLLSEDDKGGLWSVRRLF